MHTDRPKAPPVGTGLAPDPGLPGIWSAGAAEGDPLVLVHGTRLSALMWDPHARRLAPRFRVTAPDLPGHGSLRGRPFRLDEAVAQVGLAVAEAARVTGRRPVVAGSSLGGYVTLAYGAAHPDAAAALLVQGATAQPDGATGLVYRAAARAFDALGPERAVRLNDRAFRRRLPAESYEAVMRGGLAMPAFGEVVDELARYDFLGLAGRCRLPVLFVNGLGDRLFRTREREFLAAARSGGGRARLFHVHGPHIMSLTDPAAFTRTLERGHALLVPAARDRAAGGAPA
ncbi:alpha/beta fold hydrolase [Streptomyces sp. NPDC096033]|uniref:alpha/beta fold hydrolase n=1 Tax=Streptomyces sp. NPDC096033 TaxID=3366071 RepID=UPI003818820F